MCERVPDEIKRREVELDRQVSPEEIMSREVELGCESWTSFASGCLCDSARAGQLKQQLRSALVAAQWRGRGHRLNTSIVLAVVHAGSLRPFSGGIRG